MCLWTFSYLFEFFFFKQKTAYELRISDWSSDVCSSDLRIRRSPQRRARDPGGEAAGIAAGTPRDGGGLSARATRTLRPRLPRPAVRHRGDRQSVVEGKSVSVRVYLGGRRILKQKKSLRIKIQGYD